VHGRRGRRLSDRITRNARERPLRNRIKTMSFSAVRSHTARNGKQVTVSNTLSPADQMTKRLTVFMRRTESKSLYQQYGDRARTGVQLVWHGHNDRLHFTVPATQPTAFRQP